MIPVYWGPSGIAVGVAPFVHIKDRVGYGVGVTYVRDMQTVAMPFYYSYNLTGAHPYRLEVKINTTEKKIAEADGWIYINVTYGGYLKLYLGDMLVAYDALYGWTIRRDQAPPPPYIMNRASQKRRASRRRSEYRRALNTETLPTLQTATR